MGSYIKKKIKYLVVDTSAFINNAALQEIGENILTVPQVINEIKSKRQLQRLIVLPYDLQVKETFAENIKFVNEFSKKTGDFISLSATDISVIALTYQLEKEKNGTSHLNTAPLCKTVIEPYNSIPTDLKSVVGFHLPKKVNGNGSQSYSNAASDQDDDLSEYDSAEDKEYYDAREELDLSDCHENEKNKDLSNDIQNLDNIEKLICKQIHKLNVDSNFKRDEDNNSSNNDNKNEYYEGNVDADDDDTDTDADAEDEDDDDDDDDDDSDWITPSNVESVKSKIANELVEDFENVTVACLTTDYAMQNVLKQIGLNVVSLDGKLIKQLRTFILRCYGCFKTTSVMTKVFCPNCGNKTLKKVGVSLNADGTQHLHINFRKPLTARGKQFSIPRPKGGKHSNNPILFEDQPMPQQKPSRLSRTKNNPLNDDYITGYSPFVMRDVTSKSAMLGIKPHIEMKHWMRRNPNENKKHRK